MGDLNWWPATEPMVLYEDNHCLALAKPPGMPSVGDRTRTLSALAWAREYIKHKHGKPGNVYLGVVHRLDQPVSGVLLFARTSKAAARLNEQFRDGTVQKLYWAIVEGRAAWTERLLEHFLFKDRRRNLVRVVDARQPGAKHARLHASVLIRHGQWSLLQIEPQTGRSHQIRVQLAAVGLPIVGDRKYGARTAFAEGIALHAARLVIRHPTRKEPLELVAPLPVTWQRFRLMLEKAVDP